MNERTLDHVGIAVPSLDDAVPLWEALLGSPASGRMAVESQGIEVAFVGSGPSRVELLAPTRTGSAVARFLERQGPGLHHVCYRVPDLPEALESYTAAGFELLSRRPRMGASGHLVAFLNPRSTGGTLVELVEAGP